MSNDDGDRTPRFQIPADLAHTVKFVPTTDLRTDEEILEELSTFRPVTGERNVWAFWHSGLYAMAEWQQRNVCDWVRRSGKRWTIRVLDNIPSSESYMLRYIPETYLGKHFIDRSMTGPYVGQHSSDFIRCSTIYLYGGIWSDVGLILLADFDKMCWDKLEDPATPWNVCAAWMSGTMINNCFIAGRKGDPFIKRWHECFLSIWQGHSECTGISHHPIMQGMGFDLDSKDLLSGKFDFDLLVPPRDVYEYAGHMMSWMRVCMCEGSDQDPFNGVKYWQEHILLFDVLQELLIAESRLGWADIGPKLFELLGSEVPTIGRPEPSEAGKKAEIMWKVITDSCGMKVSRSGKLFKAVGLGTILDMPENSNKDRAAGTCAELLRYASRNFKQTRQSIRFVPPPMPLKTLPQGCLET